MPGTVATSIRQSGHPVASQDWDDYDWWYRCQFDTHAQDADKWIIRFDGLATYADVWLNGQQILACDNMFRSYEADISQHITAENQVHIAFRSLARILNDKKKRPRWKTNLVEHQQLRWHRTTLLGRIPGWTPPIKPIGPWQGIYLERRRHLEVSKLRIQPRLVGNNTQVYIYAELSGIQAQQAAPGQTITAELRVGDSHYPVPLSDCGTHLAIDQFIAVEAPLWWPHTHGDPSLIDYTLDICLDGNSNTLSSGKLGFKKTTVVRRPINGDTSGLSIEINDTLVFCRGACWTVNNIQDLIGDTEQLERSLTLARDAGVNMLRIGGTMLYEQQAFYALCDELGILVWQDFMFANMDYPAADEGFLSNTKQEVEQQLRRLSQFACIAVYCGNSEVQQQAAMFGMPADHWQNPLFDQHIPALCNDLHPGIPYFPSTPCEGALPFHVGAGLSHFYGTGAYQRDLSDRIIDRVKFTPECLGFSHIPADNTIATAMDGSPFAPHHPQWKAGIPRDTGTGWDFEDIRDYYLKALYRVEPATLRYSDSERYLQLSRSVTGEVMTQVFSRWRASNNCGGALVWFFKDLVAGAGWGLLDVHNQPKAVYYQLRRVWRKRTVLLTDNGLDGVVVTGVNETPEPFKGTLELGLLDRGQHYIAREVKVVDIDPHSRVSISGDELLGRFYDTTYNYRFGPAKHDLVFARLLADDATTVSDAYCFPNGLSLTTHDSAAVEFQIDPTDEGLQLTLKADRFLQCVNIAIRDHEADDNFFHLLPNVEKTIRWRRTADEERPFRGTLSALNLAHPIRVKT